MNLADAIRKASQAPTPMAATDIPANWDEPALVAAPSHPETFPSFEEEQKMIDEPTFESSTSGTTVRLEMFLTPEQLSSLFRAVAANQHTLLTSREAANFLRITPSALEAMAGEGTVPGFLVDGRWRFSKQALDEWLTQQKFQKEAA